MEVVFIPKFLRLLKKLPPDLQEEVMERIGLFKDKKNHKLLKVHKLHGRLKEYYGFSIDFRNRIVFDYLSDTEVVLLAVGDHTVYS